jgi:hypothetical protein
MEKSPETAKVPRGKIGARVDTAEKPVWRFKMMSLSDAQELGPWSNSLHRTARG